MHLVKKGFLLGFMAFICSSCSDNKKEFQGFFEAENIYISVPYSGILNLLAVQAGESVKKGQLLFQLDKNPEQLVVNEYKETLNQAMHTLKDLENPSRQPEMEAIQAQIEQVKAEKALALVRLERQQKLFAKGVVNQDTVDAAMARYKEQVQLESQYSANLKLAQMGGREEQIAAQKASIESIKAKYEQALWQLAQKESRSPSAGIIFDTYYTEGELVAAQQPILSLLTPENVHIEFFLSTEYLSNLKIGQAITFKIEGVSEKSKATIYYVSPEAEYMPPLIYSRDNNSKLVFRIKASVPDFNQYKPGQPVTVYLP